MVKASKASKKPYSMVTAVLLMLSIILLQSIIITFAFNALVEHFGVLKPISPAEASVRGHVVLRQRARAIAAARPARRDRHAQEKGAGCCC